MKISAIYSGKYQSEKGTEYANFYITNTSDRVSTSVDYITVPLHENSTYILDAVPLVSKDGQKAFFGIRVLYEVK